MSSRPFRAWLAVLLMVFSLTAAALGQSTPYIGGDPDGNLELNSADGRAIRLNGVNVINIIEQQQATIEQLRAELANSGSGPPAGFAGIRNGSLQLYGSDSWEAAFKMASIRNIDGIDGALSIDNNPGMLHLDGFENMVNVTGDVEIDTNANLLETRGFTRLTAIGGRLRVHNNDALRSVDMAAVATIGGALQVARNDVLAGLGAFQSLRAVGGGVTIENNRQLTHVDGLSALERVDGELRVTSNPMLEHLDGFGALAVVNGSVTISSLPNLTDVDGLAQLATVTGDLSVNDNQRLAHLNGLQRMAQLGDCRIMSNPNLADFSGLGNLITVTDAFTVEYNNRPMNSPRDYNREDRTHYHNTTFSLEAFSSLAAVGGQFRISNERNITRVVFPALRTVGEDFSMNNLPNATDLTFDTLASVGGNFNLRDMANMTHVSFAALESVGGNFWLCPDHPEVGSFDFNRGFPNLASLGGSFVVDCSRNWYGGGDNDAGQLQNLTGYPSLRRIGGQLSFPRDLRNVGGIMGFDALEFVGRFAVSDNQRITVVSGFNRLITCNGSLYVNNNDHLGSISGFNGLVTVNGDMRIAGSYNQEGHPSVTGFNQLEEVSGILYLGRIRSLVGFGALARAGSFIVENNRRILAFPAFNALQTVPGNFYIQDSDNMPAVDGFNALVTVGGDFKMDNNQDMPSLDGFNALETGMLFERDYRMTHIIGFNALQTVNQSLKIKDMDDLRVIRGFNTLTTIGGMFEIELQSGRIEELSGFGNLRRVCGPIRLRRTSSAVERAIQGRAVFANLQCHGGCERARDPNDPQSNQDGAQYCANAAWMVNLPDCDC